MGIFGNKPSEPGRPAEPAPQPRPESRAAAPSSAPTASARCVIGPKTTFKGELVGEDDVSVQGTVEGQIKVARELRVETGGHVRATVEAETIVVGGELSGNCAARTRIEIQASGRLTGDIRAPRIVIAEGALFRGKSEMGPARAQQAAASPTPAAPPPPSAPKPSGS